MPNLPAYQAGDLELSRYANKKMIDVEAQLQIEDNRTQQMGSRLLMREEFRCELRYEVAENYAGMMVLVRIYKERKATLSSPILTLRHLRMRIMYEENRENPSHAILTWDGGGMMLEKKEISSRGLFHALERAGHSLRVGKNRTSEVAACMFAFLMKTAEYVRYFSGVGWHRSGEQWEYSSDENACEDSAEEELPEQVAVIKSFLTNKSLIADWGCRMRKPIGIVTDSELASNVFEVALTGLPVVTVDASVDRSRMEKILCSNAHLVAMYFFQNNERGRNVLNWMAGATMAGSFNGQSIFPVPVVILSEQDVIRGDAEDLLILRLDRLEQTIHVPSVVPSADNIAIIRELFEEVRTGDYDEEELPLIAAACCLYPRLEKTVIMDLIYRINEDYERNVATQAATGIEVAVVRALYDCCPSEIAGVCSTNEVTMAVENGLLEMMLYDDDFVYISETLLKVVLQDLMMKYPVGFIKQTIKSAGLIKADRDRYTTKVEIVTATGKALRRRMIAFKRDVIHALCPDEFDFVEFVLTRKEKSDER